VWVCEGNLVGLEDEQVNQDLEGEGVGSGERRKGEPWNENQLQESSILRVDKLAISATCKELQYGTSFSNE